MQKLILLITVTIFLAGCATTWENLQFYPTENTVKINASHIMQIDMEDKLKRMLSQIKFDYVTKKTKDGKEKEYLYIIGSVRKPFGKDLYRASIVAKFYDERGDIIVEGRDRISPRRTRLHRGSTGKFIVGVLYNPSIQKCKVTIEWK